MVWIQHLGILNDQAAELWSLALSAFNIKGGGEAGSHALCWSRLTFPAFEEFDEVRHRPTHEVLLCELMAMLEDEWEHPAGTALSLHYQLLNAWMATRLRFHRSTYLS